MSLKLESLLRPCKFSAVKGKAEKLAKKAASKTVKKLTKTVKHPLSVFKSKNQLSQDLFELSTRARNPLVEADNKMQRNVDAVRKVLDAGGTPAMQQLRNLHNREVGRFERSTKSLAGVCCRKTTKAGNEYKKAEGFLVSSFDKAKRASQDLLSKDAKIPKMSPIMQRNYRNATEAYLDEMDNVLKKHSSFKLRKNDFKETTITVVSTGANAGAFFGVSAAAGPLGPGAIPIAGVAGYVAGQGVEMTMRKAWKLPKATARQHVTNIVGSVANTATCVGCSFMPGGYIAYPFFSSIAQGVAEVAINKKPNTTGCATNTLSWLGLDLISHFKM